MKGLTLTQPWATLVARGCKRFETRSWSTTYRGEVAIHAAKALPKVWRDFAGEPFLSALAPLGLGVNPYGAVNIDRLPLGAIVALVDLTEVKKTEHALTRYVIEGTPEESFVVRGALSLWKITPDVEAQVRERT